MTSLLDIAPAVEAVDIGEHKIECVGISAGDLVRLIQRFPALRDALWQGRASQPGEMAIDPASLINEAPDAISAVLAAGTGHLGEIEHEKAASRLSIDAQIDLLAAILRLTLPQGVGPFVQKLTDLFGAVGASPRLPPIGSVDESQPLPNGKAASDTISPSPSNA